MPTFTHGKATRILVEGADLSAYFKEYTAANRMDTAETSAFGTNTKTYVQGMSDSTLTLSGYFDGTVGAVDEILEANIGSTQNTVVTVAPDGRFVLGARVVAGQSIETDYSVVGGVGGVVETSAVFQANGTIRNGVSLHDLVAEIGGITGGSVDQGIGLATVNGGVLTVHVTSGGAATFTVQTSADNTTFVDYATVATTGVGGFSAVVTAVQNKTANRYVRLISTSGAITFQSSFVRL